MDLCLLIGAIPGVGCPFLTPLEEDRCFFALCLLRNSKALRVCANLAFGACITNKSFDYSQRNDFNPKVFSSDP